MNDANSENPDLPPADSGTAGGGDPGAGESAEVQSLRRDPDAGESAEVQSLRRSLASSAADAQGLQRELRNRQRELDQLRGTLTVALLTLRKQLEAVESSWAWRYGHGVTRTLRRLRRQRLATAGGVTAAIGQVDRVLELIGAPGAAGRREDPQRSAGPAARAGEDPARRASPEDELLLGRRIRDSLGPPPSLDSLPPVSVVVVSRSQARCQALLELLEKTDYPALEVVLIDNASDSGAVGALAHTEAALEVVTERFEVPVSFAQASNAGAEKASSDLLLFLNDDIRPPEPGWLRELVAATVGGGGAVAGATLVDPHVDAEPAARASGWRIEQRGISIGVEDGAFVPVRRSAEELLFGEGFGIDSRVAAVSGACLLIAAPTFEALGAFDTGYQFGLEDVDLCLRARARGLDVVCSGRAIVVHEGSSTQTDAGREFRRVNRAINRKRFWQLWGPALRRDRLQQLLDGDPAWGSGPHVAIARTSNDPADGWGDYYTAAELGNALAQIGWQVSYVAQKGADAGTIPPDSDVAVVLTDRWDVREFPAHTITCAWIRNWTERWLTRPWLDRYDVLLASSRRSLQLLADATGRPVELFALATNPDKFRSPAPDQDRALDWVFTGNRWGEPRAIEAAIGLLEPQAGAIYGRGWQEVPGLAGYARDAVAYEQLPEIYADAKVVLDDTAEPTLAYDAVNSRVFDALACGALVLTNCERGVRELFDADFPTWSEPAQLAERLQELLGAPERRAELVGRYQQAVLERHTYSRRADRLRAIVTAANQQLSFCLKIGAPDWEQAERWGDLHLAVGLGRALRRLGHRWRVEILPEWDRPEGSAFDVVVHLHGRSVYSPNPGQFNVLWLISHPEAFNDSLADGFDLVCVASAPFAAALRQRVGTPVEVLEQATDPRVFFPDPDPALSHELAIVGNSRGVRRKILDDLLPTRHDLALWGSGWAGTPAERHVLGEYVPNDELRRVYSSAQIVLCDHWPEMRAEGFRSNRLYDALACGAVVISDAVAGLEGSLGDAVVTYEDRQDLAAAVERLLGDPGERRRRADGARERILAHETFDHRAVKLVRWVREAQASEHGDRRMQIAN